MSGLLLIYATRDVDVVQVFENQNKVIDLYRDSFHQPLDFYSITDSLLNRTYRNRRVHPLDIALLDQDLPCLGAQRLHFILLDDFAPLQLFNLPVQVTVIGHCCDLGLVVFLRQAFVPFREAVVFESTLRSCRDFCVNQPLARCCECV